MTKIPYFVRDYYNKQVVHRIVEKYGMSPIDACREFLTSQTHALLEDSETGLTMFPERAVFDMWENEKVTGDPRNSIYVRSE